MMIKLFRRNIYRSLVFDLANQLLRKLLKTKKKKCKKKKKENLRDEGENNKMVVGFDDEK